MSDKVIEYMAYLIVIKKIISIIIPILVVIIIVYLFSVSKHISTLNSTCDYLNRKIKFLLQRSNLSEKEVDEFLREQDLKAEKAEMDKPEITEQQTSQHLTICPNCGAHLNGDEAMCNICGALL